MSSNVHAARAMKPLLDLQNSRVALPMATTHNKEVVVATQVRRGVVICVYYNGF